MSENEVAQPIPSGGERQSEEPICEICISGMLHRAGEVCPRYLHHLERSRLGNFPLRVDDSMPPNEVKIVGANGTSVKITNIGQPVSAEATKPKCKHLNMYGHEWETWCSDCGQRWPNSLAHSVFIAKGVIVGQPKESTHQSPASPPSETGSEIRQEGSAGSQSPTPERSEDSSQTLAPPEAEGAREQALNWLWDEVGASSFPPPKKEEFGTYTANFNAYAMAQLLVKYTAQKEAEISRLWNDRQRALDRIDEQSAEISRLTAERDQWKDRTRNAEKIALGRPSKEEMLAAEAANTELRTALRHVIADAEAWAQVTHYLVEGRETYIKWTSLDAGKAALAKGE